MNLPVQESSQKNLANNSHKIQPWFHVGICKHPQSLTQENPLQHEQCVATETTDDVENPRHWSTSCLFQCYRLSIIIVHRILQRYSLSGASQLIATYRLKKMNHPTTTSAIAVVPASTDDVSSSSNQKSKKGPRGGIYDPFPLKFHRALDQIRDEGMESIVSWVPHGRAFKIHKPKVFAATISKIRLVEF